MAKKSKPKAKKPNKNGRPTKYKEEFAEQVYRLALLGLKDLELMEYFNVAESTLNLWKTKHDDFSEALKEGREIADDKVVKALYNKACGFEESIEETVFDPKTGKPTVATRTRKHLPDTTAIIFWLKNRQRKHWRDRIDNTHSDPEGGPIQTITRTIIDPKAKDG